MSGEPREFGPYRLLRRLGVGGMAEAFEATRMGASGFEQRVCLKRVLPAFGEDRDFVARFRREARLAARLRHTNIVGVVGFGEVLGLQYMALELVDGVDLRSFLRSLPGERLAPDMVALIGFDLARALEHAHGTLVHRDVSTSNVLLSRTGEAKLADFGLAKAIDDTTATASRSAKGKIPYMSPEQMRGEALDGRADLFSLGVVMFEAATGARPFDGAHDVETMQRIIGGDARSLRELVPEMPEPLRGAIEALIQVNREQRTPSAARLVEELAAVLPPPAVRNELARMVESQRGGPMARMHVRAREQEPDTDLSRLPPFRATEPPPKRHVPPPRKPPRRRVLLAALAVVLGAAVGIRWLGERAPVAESATVVEAATVAESATAVEAAPTSQSAPASEPASPPEPASAPAPAPRKAKPRAAKGWVHVIVEPWGNVWIDGVWMGRAPVRARLPKGRHVIKAGRNLPTATRVVRLEPGARKNVELTLTE